MKLLIAITMVIGTSTAFAQGSAATGSAGSGSAATAPADPAPTPAPAAPAAVDVPARKAICEAALVKPPGDDPRFIGDVQALALGQVAQPQLAKTPEGLACIDAITGADDFRSTVTTAASNKQATELAADVQKQHEDAAKAIAKNQKHVVLAYAALWILAAGFLLFLWRRQQGLKTEIAQLKRDLDAATK